MDSASNELSPASPTANLEAARLRVVLATIVINIVAVFVLSFVSWSDWRTGVGLNLIDNSLLIAHAIRRRDRLMLHLILYGLVVGFCELPADAWLVDGTRTLDYSPGGGPMIWRSPIWMPFAWEIVAVQFGYIGMRLFERFGVAGALLAGLLGAINIPYYEEMALQIHWWSYRECRMLLHTPYYIILGEFFIAFFFAVTAGGLRREQIWRTVALGVAGGAAIFVGYGAAYAVTG